MADGALVMTPTSPEAGVERRVAEGPLGNSLGVPFQPMPKG